MLNQFRTLLLNLSYDPSSPEDHIPADFIPRVLPTVLSRVYDILFPPKTSRFYKQFLAQNYLGLIDAAGMSDVTIEKDNRMSYSLDTGEFFKIHRNSNPIQGPNNNGRFPVFVSGSFITNLQSNYYYDQFTITQIGHTNNVSIKSDITGLYHNEIGTATSPDFSTVELVFEDGVVSKPVNISTTGISFCIAGTNASFTDIDTAGKTWTFTVESPYVFNFQTVYNNLNTSNLPMDLFNYRKDVDVSNHQNIWLLHYNSVYKFAAFLSAYVAKVQTL